MIDEWEIRDKLIDAASGKIPMEELADWLDEMHLELREVGSDEARRLADAITLLFSEHDQGYLSDSGLRQDLFDVLDLSLASIRLRLSGTAEPGRPRGRFQSTAQILQSEEKTPLATV